MSTNRTCLTVVGVQDKLLKAVFKFMMETKIYIVINQPKTAKKSDDLALLKDVPKQYMAFYFKNA